MPEGGIYELAAKMALAVPNRPHIQCSYAELLELDITQFRALLEVMDELQ